MDEVIIGDKGKFYFANGMVLWIGALIVWILWMLARRDWSLLGISYPIMSDLVIGLSILFMVAYVVEMFAETRSEESQEELLKAAPFLPSTWKEYGQFTFLAFSAGVCEEVVYRGFLVNYLYAQFTDPVWAYNVAVVFPAVIFGVVHMYQGFKSVLKISVMALLFGTIFIFSESLLIVIVLHVLVDLLGGYFGLMINKNSAGNNNLS
jgi:membrane protease YdiL (CAAX protease family)